MALSFEDNSMRNILLGWSELSEGDVSVIQAALRNRTASVLTIMGTPHAALWDNLVNLAWAEKLYSPVDPILLEKEPLCFRLTNLGSELLPKFIAQKNLLLMAKHNFSTCDEERRQLRSLIAISGENAPGFWKNQ